MEDDLENKRRAEGENEMPSIKVVPVRKARELESGRQVPGQLLGGHDHTWLWGVFLFVVKCLQVHAAFLQVLNILTDEALCSRSMVHFLPSPHEMTSSSLELESESSGSQVYINRL